MRVSSFVTVASDFLSKNELEKIIVANSAKLYDLCVARIEKTNILKAEEVFYFIVTGGTEAQVLALQKIRDAKFKNEEIVLLAYESNNSLATSMELLARFNQIGKKGRIIYLPDSEKLKTEATNIQHLNWKGH